MVECHGSSDQSHIVDPLSYFSFHPVLHDWSGMYYPVCGMMYIKEPLLLIRKSSPCGSSGFPLCLRGHLPHVWCHITIKKVLSVSLNKTFPSFLPIPYIILVNSYHLTCPSSYSKIDSNYIRTYPILKQIIDDNITVCFNTMANSVMTIAAIFKYWWIKYRIVYSTQGVSAIGIRQCIMCRMWTLWYKTMTNCYVIL